MPIELIIGVTVINTLFTIIIGICMFVDKELSLKGVLLWMFSPIIICSTICYNVLHSEKVVAQSQICQIQQSEIGDMTVYHFSYESNIDSTNYSERYKCIHLPGKPKTNTAEFIKYYKSWLFFYHNDTEYEFVEDVQ